MEAGRTLKGAFGLLRVLRVKLVSLVEAGVAGQTPFGNSYGWGEHPWVGVFACEVEKPVKYCGFSLYSIGCTGSKVKAPPQQLTLSFRQR